MSFIPLGSDSYYSAGNKSDCFMRPKGQFSPRNSPVNGSPRTMDADFIPLGSSSPRNRSGNTPGHTPNQWRGNSRHNRSNGYSPYTNKNNSYVNSSPRFHNRYSPRGGSQGRRGTDNPGHVDDISKYYHPSMLEDPWLELETKDISTNDSLLDTSTNTPPSPDSSEEPSDAQDGYIPI